MPSVTLQRKAANANIANQCCVKADLSFSPLCLCRLDDLAVDSDEEVDYSKMDQVTSDISQHLCYESHKTCKGVSTLCCSAFWSQQAALLAFSPARAYFERNV